jgi:hypothetical protein
MPYITPDQRHELDPWLQDLSNQLNFVKYDYMERAGRLNYCMTRLALEAFPVRKYWMLALVCGVFVTALLEYYRRWVGPYENEKWAENGDVYPDE